MNNPAALQRVWMAVSNTIKKEKQSFAAMLVGVKAHPSSDGQAVAIEFPASNPISLSMARKPDMQALLTKAFNQAAGFPVPFQLVGSDAGAVQGDATAAGSPASANASSGEGGTMEREPAVSASAPVASAPAEPSAGLVSSGRALDGSASSMASMGDQVPTVAYDQAPTDAYDSVPTDVYDQVPADAYVDSSPSEYDGVPFVPDTPPREGAPSVSDAPSGEGASIVSDVPASAMPAVPASPVGTPAPSDDPLAVQQASLSADAGLPAGPEVMDASDLSKMATEAFGGSIVFEEIDE